MLYKIVTSSNDKILHIHFVDIDDNATPQEIQDIADDLLDEDLKPRVEYSRMTNAEMLYYMKNVR